MIRACLLVVLLAAPVGLAQEWQDWLEDPVDTKVWLADTQEAETERFHGADLRALRIMETDEGFALEVDLSDPPATGLGGEGDGTIEVHFAHGAQGYVVRIRHGETLFTDTEAHLYARDASGVRDQVAKLDVEHDATTWVFRVGVPRALIPDEHAAPPFAGRTLTDWFVTADSWRIINGCDPTGCRSVARIADRMPDDGVGSPFEITFETGQGETARLSSVQPLRASNGEAATFAFNVTAGNGGSTAQTYQFSVAGAPSGWTVTTPRSLTLQPGEFLAVQVLVTVPFAHQHGVTETFELSMHGAAADVAHIELGIDYLSIAQPSGHHSMLYLHSRVLEQLPVNAALGMSSMEAYMNTLEVDEASAGEPVPGTWGAIISTVNGETYGSGWFWNVPLHPALRMGLQFDANGTGAYSFDFNAPNPMVGGTIRVGLLHEGPANSETLFFHEHPFEGPLMGSHNVGGTFSVDLDRIAQDPEANLELRIQLWDRRVTLATADRHPELLGGTIAMPLLEYTDQVATVPGGVQMVSGAPQDEAPAPTKESPALGLPLGIATVALLRRGRRF